MSSTQQELQRAFRLIKHGATEGALAVVRPIIQREPDNIDAWWLLAYAETDPQRAREALLTVLRLNPDYPNAPQARAMLDKLNREYPPEPDEVAQFPELQTETPAAPSAAEPTIENEAELPAPFEELAPLEPADSFADTFEIAEFEEDEDEDEELFAVGSDPFAELDDDPFADLPAATTELDEDPFADLADTSTEPLDMDHPPFAAIDDDPFDFDEFQVDDALIEEEIAAEPPLVAYETDEVVVSESALAAAEERQQRRGARTFVYGLLGLMLVAALVAAFVFVVLSLEDDDANADLDDLQVVASESTAVEEAKIAAAQELEAANVDGDMRVVAATSDLGDTLFVELCSRPTPDLPELINRAMLIAAEQAPRVDGILPAVGVSIDHCTVEGRDTLYRAAAPVSEALRYLEDQDTYEELEAWSTFQSTWRTMQ